MSEFGLIVSWHSLNSISSFIEYWVLDIIRSPNLTWVFELLSFFNVAILCLHYPALSRNSLLDIRSCIQLYQTIHAVRPSLISICSVGSTFLIFGEEQYVRLLKKARRSNLSYVFSRCYSDTVRNVGYY